MKKVINLFTKEEILFWPYEKQVAKEVMAYLLTYKRNTTHQEQLIINQLIKMVENNSGIDKADVLKTLIGKSSRLGKLSAWFIGA